MWTITIGATAGVSSSLQQAVTALLQTAAEYWGRYIDFGGATLEIELSFENFGDTTLAEGGTDYFALTSGPNAGLLQAAPIIELTTGVDMNGSTADIFITVDAATLTGGEFYLGGPHGGGPEVGDYDLFTVLLHEIAHGLGFISFTDGVGEPESVFDTFLFVTGGSTYFNGPEIQNLGFGSIRIEDGSHYANNGLLKAFLFDQEIHHISRLDTGILSDIGLPVPKATEGDDILFGHGAEDGALRPTSSPSASYDDVINLLGGDDTYFALSGNDIINGGDGDDTIDGGSGNDLIYGDAGADTLNGGSGNDILRGDGSDFIDGGDDDDTIEVGSRTQFNAGSTGGSVSGGAGDDEIYIGAGVLSINGGDGFDELFFAEDLDGVSISLLDGQATIGGFSATVANIESLEGTNGDDDLRGDNFANTITTLLGSDTVYGYGGDDYIEVQGGNNDVTTVYGGDGADEIRGGGPLGSVYGGDGADFILSSSVIFGGDGDDTIVNGSRFASGFPETAAYGEGGNDVMEGGVLYGGDGDDTLTAKGLSTVLLNGGAGDDVLNGSFNESVFIGGPGADTLNGLSGDNRRNIADYRDSVDSVSVDLALLVAGGGDAQGDVLINMQHLAGSDNSDLLTGDHRSNELSGRDGDDLLRGRQGDDLLFGGAGVDTLLGGPGNDILNGGAGADILDGQFGSDWASYEGAGSRVALELYLGSGRVGDAAGDQYIDIMNVIGSEFGDYIVGSSDANELRGGGGWDVLIGAGGDDILTGGRGADVLDGGAGNNAAGYADAASGVSLTLYNGTGIRGDAVGDTFINIRDIIGSSFDDYLFGDSQANVIKSGAGDDTLFGGNGWDNLQGGAGDDILRGGIGHDILNGGEGVDLADYSRAAVAVNIDLNTGAASGGEATGDVLIDLEGVIGSNFADVIVGVQPIDIVGIDDVKGVFDGRGGADDITGFGRFIGGEGDDIFRLQADENTIVYETGDGYDEIFGAVVGRYERLTSNPRNTGVEFELSLGAAFDTFDEVMTAATQVGDDVVFDFGAGEGFTVYGVSKDDFYDRMFIFPDAVTGAGSSGGVAAVAVLTAEDETAIDLSVVYDPMDQSAIRVAEALSDLDAFGFDDPLV